MKPAQFVYHAPATVSEAVTLLSAVAAYDGRVLAGGQSLVPNTAATSLRVLGEPNLSFLIS